MGLPEIAAGIETTTRQRESGIAAVDATDRTLPDRLEPFASDLPCDATAAATVVEEYTGGASVGASGRAAGVTPMTAAKTLHLLGVEGVTPFSPMQRGVLDDWLCAEITRADALALTGASEAEFALAAFVATHDPLEGVRECVEGALASGGAATTSDVTDLL